MKIKLDENIPELGDIGHECDTVISEGLQGSDDSTVFGAAQAEFRFFVTQDLDFSDVRKYAPGSHSGILLLRLRSPSRSALISRLRRIFKEQDVDDWRGCFVIATETKVRVLKPK